MEQSYQYDAFISYRHLTPDKPIAEQLQKLLETYTPPKGFEKGADASKLRIFRDETELPTSSDLGNDIKTALEQSRFLIVVCSRCFQNSKWCMQELEYFKSLHNGNNDNILTLWVGDINERPRFPDTLRFKDKKVLNPDGTEFLEPEEIEPLAANVGAESKKQAIKKLKTEFLRLAAPLLSCSYDDLFMREQRRQTRRKLTTALSIIGVLIVVALLSTTALFKITAQNRELEKTNAEILVKESEALKLAGDLYGALDSAVQAISDGGKSKPFLFNALKQTVSLSGAFQPEIFTSTNSLPMSAKIDELFLLQNGTRMLALSKEHTSLVDVETGEHILNLPGGCYEYNRQTACFFSSTVDSVVIDSFDSEVVNFDDIDFAFSKMQKHIQTKTAQNEEDFFYIDNEQGLLKRLSSVDGTVIWSSPCENACFPFDALLSNEIIPVDVNQANGSGLWLIDANTGNSLGQIDAEVLESFFGARYYDVYYMNGYLILAQQNDGGLSIIIYKRTKQGFDYLHSISIEAPAFSQNIKKAFMIKENTLLVSTIVFDYLNQNYISIFKGYDLLTESQKWSYKTTSANQGCPFVGYIKESEINGLSEDIAFSSLSNIIVAVGAKTGKVLFSRTTSIIVTELYYSENGNVFFIDKRGREFCLQFQKLTRIKADNDYNMVFGFLHDFKSELRHVSHCNNVYAVLPQKTDQIQIYTAFNNYNKDIIYQSTDTKGLSHCCFDLSPDKKLMVVRNATESAVVIDLQTKDVLFALAFRNERIDDFYFTSNEYLQVFCSYNDTYSIHLIDLHSGDEILTLPVDSFLSIKENPSSAELLCQDRLGTIYSILPTSKPKKVLDVYSVVSNYDLVDSSSIYPHIMDFYVSPSGENLALIVDKMGNQEEVELYVFNRNKASVVSCGRIDIVNPFSNVDINSTWNEKKNEFYLILDKVLFAFDYALGECFVRWDDTELVGILFVEKSLCLIDIFGRLNKATIDDSRLIINNTIDAHIPIVTEPIKYSFAYESNGKQNGFLQYRYNNGEGEQSTAWLIDEKTFEIIYEIKGFSGFDAKKSLIYTRDLLNFYSYPLYSPQALKAYACSILE